MLPADRVNQLRKGDLGGGGQDEDGFQPLVSGGGHSLLDGEGQNAGHQQNCTIVPNLPPPHQAVAPHQVGGSQRGSTARSGSVRVRQLRDIRQESREEELSKGVSCCNDDADEEGNGLFGFVLASLSLAIILLFLPFSLCACLKVVQEYERAVIFRLGRLRSGGAKGPGIFFVIPCIDKYHKVDLRTITLGVPPQEVLTRDSVTISVDAVVYYRVSNSTLCKTSVENAHHSTMLLSQTLLTSILGTKYLHQILSDRHSISGSMRHLLDEATEPWGIKVERVEIKDARLPVQLQRAMAAEAEAAREARAKAIQASGEAQAAQNLQQAGQVIKTSSALHLRYMQALTSISRENNSTVIFPLPADVVDKLN